MTITTVNGTTIAFEDAGAGSPPLLLVHGFGGDRTHFGPQIAALRDRHRVVAPDRSGHGESGRPAGPLTVDHYADELAGLCDDLGLDRVVVVQHSFDKPAIELAARRPDLVAGLVLLDSPTIPSAEWLADADAMVGGLASEGWRAALRAFAERWVFPDFLPAADRDGILAMVGAVGQDVLASTWRSFVEHDARPALRTIGCPVLYVAGCFPCDLDALATEVADLEVAELRGRGHMLTFAAPDEVSALIEKFGAHLLA